MASSFDITTATNTLTLDNTRKGVAVFTVKNLTRRSVHAQAEALIDPASGAKWLTILPPNAAVPDTNAPNSRDIPVDGDTTFQVQVAVPMDAPAGSFKLKLKVAEETNPDDNFSESPDVVFTVREIPKPVRPSFPIWIIPAILIVVVIIVAIIVIAITSNNNELHVQETATAVAIAQLTEDATQAAIQTQTQAAIFALQTSAANSDISNQTLSAAISMTAAQNVALTQTAIARTVAAQATATRGVALSQTAAAGTAGAQATATRNGVFTQTAAAAQTVVAQQTRTALSVYVGDWIATDAAGKKLGLTITDAGSNKLDLVAITEGVPDAFKVTGIPYTSTQLTGGNGNLIFVIQPINDGQLLVTVQIANLTPGHIIYHRKTRVETLPHATINQVSPNIALSQSQISRVLQGVATPVSP